jgi:hypothetical protein
MIFNGYQIERKKNKTVTGGVGHVDCGKPVQTAAGQRIARTQGRGGKICVLHRVYGKQCTLFLLWKSVHGKIVEKGINSYAH